MAPDTSRRAPGDEDGKACTLESLLEENNIMTAIGITGSEAKYPATSSSVANLNKQLRELEVRYHRTRLSLEKANLKIDQVQKEIRKVRGENQQLEKDLHKKRGLLERVASEKKVIEAQAVANRDYAKKIEQKIAMGFKGQAAATRHGELLTRIKDLEAQHGTYKQQFQEKEIQLNDALSKIAILKRSLEIRIRDMGLEGSIHNGMIYEIARLQEVNCDLSARLVQEAEQVAELKSAIDQHDKEMHDMEQGRIDAEKIIADREHELAKSKEDVLVARRQADELAEEKQMLMKFVQDQAEKLLRAEAAVKKQQTTHKHEIEALTMQMQSHVASESEAKENLAKHHQAYDKLLQAYNLTQDALVHERSCTESLRGLLEEKSSTLDQLKHELEGARDQALEWRRHSDDTDCKLSLMEADTAGYKETIMSLQMQVHTLESAAEHDSQRKLTMEKEMVEFAAQVDALTKEKNEVARAMNEAVAISASALEDKQSMELQIESLRAQVEQHKQSKQLLQNAMLEQLAAVRKQLQLERIGRLTAEGKLSSQRQVESPGIAPKSEVLCPPTPEDVTLLDLANSC